jgi:RNA-directed DNA polymerase
LRSHFTFWPVNKQGYRHAWGAKKVFSRLDYYVWWTILRWLRKKHRTKGMKWVIARYGWRKPGGRAIRWHDRGTRAFEMSPTPVKRFRLGWQKPPSFANAEGEPGA